MAEGREQACFLSAHPAMMGKCSCVSPWAGSQITSSTTPISFSWSEAQETGGVQKQRERNRKHVKLKGGEQEYSRAHQSRIHQPKPFSFALVLSRSSQRDRRRHCLQSSAGLLLIRTNIATHYSTHAGGFIRVSRQETPPRHARICSASLATTRNFQATTNNNCVHTLSRRALQRSIVHRPPVCDYHVPSPHGNPCTVDREESFLVRAGKKKQTASSLTVPGTPVRTTFYELKPPQKNNLIGGARISLPL